MAMQICYPCGMGDCPPDLVAWGTYTVAAGNPTNGTCTMSRNGGQVQQVPVTFRPDGYWSATFNALPDYDGYSCDAQYTPQGGALVNAPTESPVTVSNLALAVPVPIGGLPSPPGGPAGLAARAAVGVGGAPYFFANNYDLFAGIHSLVTVVQNRNTYKSHSVLKQTLHFGHYTVLVPRPADINAGNRYWVHCIFLDENGLMVQQATSNFPI